MSFSAEMKAVVANLESREWIQGKEVDGEKVCAHGAVKTCEVLRPGDEHILRAVMRRRGLTEDWNDTDGRTKAEVLARMRQIQVSDADLEETFGPNWRMVIAVVRRAATLTLDEAQRMDAAWAAARDAAWAAARAAAGDAAWAAAWAAAGDAAWDAAGDAAWDAARNASRDAAWYAARNASRDAAWYAAWAAAAWAAAKVAAGDAAGDAAWAAARSAVVADLVGQHGLTQDHIDTLMKPWIDALGDNWAEGMLP